MSPIYDFECPKCGRVSTQIATWDEYEVIRRVSCPDCRLLMVRVITAPAVIGKGTTRYNPNANGPDAGDRNAYESLRILEQNGKLTKKVFDSMNGKALLKRKSELTRMTPVSKLGSGEAAT